MTVKATKLALVDKMIGSITFLIENPNAQLRHSLAADAKGNEVLPTDPAACQWCALGRVAHDLGINPAPEGRFIDPEHKQEVAYSDIYCAMSSVMLPLGLDRHMFIQANDNPKGAMGRSGSLALLRDRLVHHRGAFL